MFTLVMLYIAGQFVPDQPIVEGGPTECHMVQPQSLTVVDDVVYIGDSNVDSTQSNRVAFVLKLPYCE